ncbi:et translation product-related [Anaeramoeba flamelloides]|uniref:Et translation product-related n=1 Tax=Anaeramoeba flamelloides TaxID=1746091 RepID=A0ABQ8Z5A2_9EUKA|nr:et translation product-related [Anaeramoeba flamelloides]
MKLQEHCKIDLKRMFFLFFGFTLLFGGVEAPEALFTTLLGDRGYIAITCLYTGFSINILLVAPILIRKIGTSRCVILGSILFVFIPACLIEIRFWAVCCMMFIAGNGVSIFYTASSTYVIQLSDEKSVGTIGGIFTTFAIIGALFGNLLLSLLYYANMKDQHVFIVLTLLGLFGVSIIFTIPNIDKKVDPKKKANKNKNKKNKKTKTNKKNQQEPFTSTGEELLQMEEFEELDHSNPPNFGDKNNSYGTVSTNVLNRNTPDPKSHEDHLQNKNPLNGGSFAEIGKLESKIQSQEKGFYKKQGQNCGASSGYFRNTKNTLSFILKKTAFLLMTITILEGLSTAMTSGFLPTLMEKKNIPICTTVFCFSKSLSSLILGKVSDTFGNMLVFLSSTLFGMSAAFTMTFIPGVSLGTLVACYALLGLAIGGYSIIIFPLTMGFYPNDTVNCIAFFKFTRGITIGLSMAYISHLTRQMNFFVIIIFQFITLFSILYIHLRVKSINNLIKPNHSGWNQKNETDKLPQFEKRNLVHNNSETENKPMTKSQQPIDNPQII